MAHLYAKTDQTQDVGNCRIVHLKTVLTSALVLNRSVLQKRSFPVSVSISNQGIMTRTGFNKTKATYFLDNLSDGKVSFQHTTTRNEISASFSRFWVGFPFLWRMLNLPQTQKQKKRTFFQHRSRTCSNLLHSRHLRFREELQTLVSGKKKKRPQRGHKTFFGYFSGTPDSQFQRVLTPLAHSTSATSTT